MRIPLFSWEREGTQCQPPPYYRGIDHHCPLNNQLNKALFPGGAWPWPWGGVTLRFLLTHLLLLHKLLGEGAYQNSGADKLIQTQPDRRLKPNRAKSCARQKKHTKTPKVVIKEKVDFAKFYDFTKKTTFLPTVTKKNHQKKTDQQKKTQGIP